MRDANRLILVLGLAALAACNKPANENNVVVDNDAATPTDVEALPPDESSGTPSDQLVNGADNADVNDVNAATNTGD
jgi:hypothetical protein